MNYLADNSLYQAVADQNCDTIVRLYARTAFEALSSYAPNRRRSLSSLVSRKSNFTHSEEKVDEYSHSRFRFKCMPLQSEVRTNLEEQTLDILSELMSDKSYLDHSKSIEAFNDENCSPAVFDGDTSTDVLNQQNRSPNVIKSLKNINIVISKEEEDIERILQMSALYLSNSRPDPSFVVYSQAKNHIHGIDSTCTAISYDIKIRDESIDEYHDSQEPLFDGAIAHSTPGNGHGDATGGGAGTILHLACMLDAPFILAILLVMQANVSSRYSAFRRTAIHEAASSDALNCLKLFIDLSTQIHHDCFPCNEKKDPGYAKIPFVSISPRVERTRSKFAMGDKQHNPKLSFTSTLQLINHLSKQIELGVISELDGSINLLRQIPLSNANQSALVEAFTDIFGLKPRSTAIEIMSTRTSLSLDGHGNSALHWAAFKNSTKCLSLLLELGIDPNIKSEMSGWTPLHDAAYSNSFESVKMLIKAGADMNRMANSGATPLCFASQENSTEAIRILLREGADPTIQCCGNTNSLSPLNFGVVNRFSGYTALHYAAYYNSEKAAKVLLDKNFSVHGCNLLEIPDSNDKLPIHIAVQRGSSEVLRELLHNGARIVTTATPLKQDSQSTPAMIPNSALSTSPSYKSPVSSPILRSMIPSRPISSSKPWNCLSQRSIDECRLLIDDVEKNWSPSRHPLFYPRDRVAIVEVLRVGKRLEQRGTRFHGRHSPQTIFLDLWPLVLSFCGRGWFESDSGTSSASSNVTGNNERNPDDGFRL